MTRLWKWLFKVSKKEIRRKHVDRYGCDVRCPYCKEWLSISSIEYKHKMVSDQDFGWHILCGQCEKESYRNLVAAPVPLHCDEKGDPY